MSGERQLGTFLGVFTPTILTILGVIMYLRVGWLVGNLGLLRVLVIVALANAITLVTTLAFSSVATNSRVGVGGAYFIISRSLGLELGGAIGLPLFLSQTFSVTLYAYGLAESLRIVWPGLPVMPASLAIVVAVWTLALAGAEKALRAQVVLMGFVVLSMIAMAVGALLRTGGSPALLEPPVGDIGFWAGFAVFFPAVTGVMVGLGLSGDLRDPGRAIPLGSIAAVVTGFAAYLLVPYLLNLGASGAELRSDPMVWSKIALLGPWLVLPGLWSAIFSSAVGSVLAAPRTLQALARDGLAPRVLGPRTSDTRALLPGMLVTLALAVAAVFLGDLNAVAAVVSMFFLTVYGTVNIAAAFEVLSGDPSWRPKIKVPWWLTLAGGLGCGAVMVLINPIAGAVALMAELALWLVLSRRGHKARWGDARRGIYEALIRWALMRLDERPMGARNWRPHLLAFVVDPVRELDLIRFADWFSQGRGVVTVANLVTGDLESEDLDLSARRERIKSVIDSEDILVFPEVDVVPAVVDGIVSVTQANGMAGLASNTVLLGWPESEAMRADFLCVMRKLERLNKSFVLARVKPRHLLPREERSIHVWWGGLERNSDLMLLLAHLLNSNPEWREATVKVISIASSELMKTRTESYLASLMPQIRIEAEVRVVLKPDDATVAEVIQRESAEASVVFLGLQVPSKGEEEEYSQRLETLAGDLPVVFFVKNSSVFIGELLKTPEIAKTEDTVSDEPNAPPAEPLPLPE
jgi:amino acid transporter